MNDELAKQMSHRSIPTTAAWKLTDWKTEAYDLKKQLDGAESKLTRVRLGADRRIRDLVQQLRAAQQQAREAERRRDELQEELAAVKRELDLNRRSYSDLGGR